MAAFDILGNIVIYKFKKEIKANIKKEIALKFLKQHKSVRTFLEKTDKFKGRLRIQKTKYIAGEKTKEVLYKENNCTFRFNVDTCYFSPRLASERKEIALKVKPKEKILILFGGVAPFAIVISKLSKAQKIVSVEIGRDCNKYAKENVKRNKLQNIEIIGGDVKKILNKEKTKYDRIIMARPNLKDSFLDTALSKIKKSGIIHYYGFYPENQTKILKDDIKKEAIKSKKKIKILKVKKAGEIGIKKFRFRVDFKVIN